MENPLINEPSTSGMVDLTIIEPPVKKIKTESLIVNVINTTVTPHKPRIYIRRKLSDNDTDKPFQCDKCDGAFGHKQSLVRHEKLNHYNPNVN